MNKDRSNQLDDLFAQAKDVPLLPSEDRIQKIINDGNGTSGRRLQKPDSRFTTTRGTIMTLTILGLAGLVGIGTLYLTPTQKLEPQRNSTAAATGQTAPQAFYQNTASPSVVLPLLMASPSAITPRVHVRSKATATLNHKVEKDSAATVVNQQRNELSNKFVEQFGKTLSDFWLNKVNGYKRQIDAMLTPDDLARLNRLRVRWSMTEGGLATMFGANVSGHMLTFNMGVSSKSAKSEKSAENTNDAAKQEMMKGMDPTMMLPFVRQMMLQDTSESGQILSGAIRLSDQYRSNLDELRGHVLRDFSEFIDLMANQASTFIEQHKEELSKEDQEKVEEIRTKISEGIGEIKNQEKLLTAVYNFIFEPVVMLYNGSDINGLISSTITEPVAGLKLSENQTLKQNIPNPATGNVAINYTLTEPSQRTMLRVFDAAGNVVATADQGGRPAGDHTINLDVSKWNNGTYLYHLTTQTSNGERVFSKTMQVVK